MRADLPVWRSLMFVPVTAEKFVRTGADRGADAIILDLEDAVAPSQKDIARTLIADAIPQVNRKGADVVVRRGDDIAATIRSVAPDGVDGLADGAVQDGLVLGAIRDGGGLAVVRGWNGPTERDIALHKTFVSAYARDHQALDRLRQQTEDGQVTLRVAGTYPAAEAAEAHRRLEAGGTRGRLVITF